MKLSWAQYKRFNGCISDLTLLIEMVSYYFQERSLKLAEVVSFVKSGEIGEYRGIMLKNDVFLNLKVDNFGRIKTYLTLHNENNQNSIAHRNINWFIDQSNLGDPEVEYVFQ